MAGNLQLGFKEYSCPQTKKNISNETVQGMKHIMLTFSNIIPSTPNLTFPSFAKGAHKWKLTNGAKFTYDDSHFSPTLIFQCHRPAWCHTTGYHRDRPVSAMIQWQTAELEKKRIIIERSLPVVHAVATRVYHQGKQLIAQSLLFLRFTLSALVGLEKISGKHLVHWFGSWHYWPMRIIGQVTTLFIPRIFC